MFGGHLARILAPHNVITDDELDKFPWTLLGKEQSKKMVWYEHESIEIGIDGDEPHVFRYDCHWRFRTTMLPVMKCNDAFGPYAGMKVIVRNFDKVVKTKIVECYDAFVDYDLGRPTKRLQFRSEGSRDVELAFNVQIETDKCRKIVDKFRHLTKFPIHWKLRLHASFPNGNTKVMPKSDKLLSVFFDDEETQVQMSVRKRPASALESEPAHKRPASARAAYSSIEERVCRPIARRASCTQSHSPRLYANL